MSRWTSWVPRMLGHPLNTVVGIALFLVLVVFPVTGIHVSASAELIGGNFTNTLGYLGASIAAGASVVNLHESRRHRRRVAEHMNRAELHHAADIAHRVSIRAQLDQITAHVKRPAGRPPRKAAP